MSQPNQPTSKRADELTVGDYIHDGRSIGPVEVAYTLAHPNHHGEERILLVTSDASVSYHQPGDVFPVVSADELADARRRREREDKISMFRAMIDWLEEHPEIPLPDRLDGQKSLFGPFSQQLAEIQRVAELIGKPVERKTHGGQAIATVYMQFSASAYTVYASDDGVPDPDAPLDPETPLDELPADFGADHQPEPDCCEDCDAKLDEADAIFGAEMDADAAADVLPRNPHGGVDLAALDATVGVVADEGAS